MPAPPYLYLHSLLDLLQRLLPHYACTTSSLPTQSTVPATASPSTLCLHHLISTYTVYWTCYRVSFHIMPAPPYLYLHSLLDLLQGLLPHYACTTSSLPTQSTRPATASPSTLCLHHLISTYTVYCTCYSVSFHIMPAPPYLYLHSLLDLLQRLLPHYACTILSLPTQSTVPATASPSTLCLHHLISTYTVYCTCYSVSFHIMPAPPYLYLHSLLYLLQRLLPHYACTTLSLPTQSTVPATASPSTLCLHHLISTYTVYCTCYSVSFHIMPAPPYLYLHSLLDLLQRLLPHYACTTLSLPKQSTGPATASPSTLCLHHLISTYTVYWTCYSVSLHIILPIMFLIDVSFDIVLPNSTPLLLTET